VDINRVGALVVDLSRCDDELEHWAEVAAVVSCAREPISMARARSLAVVADRVFDLPPLPRDAVAMATIRVPSSTLRALADANVDLEVTAYV
jgi:hypothetical protein